MGVGYRGQFIFVVPDKSLVAVFTGDLEGMRFYAPNNLLVNFVFPAVQADTALTANPSRHKALGAVVEQAAQGPVEGYFWETAREGVLYDGRFVRAAAPRAGPSHGLRGQAPHRATMAQFYSATWPSFAPPLTL
jgi:hypothetical protein